LNCSGVLIAGGLGVGGHDRSDSGHSHPAAFWLEMVVGGQRLASVLLCPDVHGKINESVTALIPERAENHRTTSFHKKKIDFQ
jgi:hypothetical protein